MAEAARRRRAGHDASRILMQYCTRCILPECFPFTSFDTEGVCNWCRHHKPITYLGQAALERLVAPHRSKNGQPDCILAFSGGRDSSYGLHFLKNELGMHPIAFTYDWAVVTDLARRNQARMVSALGVEHVIVSADIRKKRRFIRQNILAWLRRPELGMVTLFMAGDKQVEYYVTKLAEERGIKLVFLCRGNEYENEEFKWGYCGIRHGSPGGVMHALHLTGRLRIAAYFATQYLLNPAYINSSLFDTLFAYYVTYMMPLRFVYLWHYIPWDEQRIVSTLIQRYGWETERGTKQTWRTDDGTSPFYNYIYATLGGFTENDTFRSNQIREGVLTRDEAIALVREENKPRTRALEWYFDAVGLDGDEVLRRIDQMPRRWWGKRIWDE